MRGVKTVRFFRKTEKPGYHPERIPEKTMLREEIVQKINESIDRVFDQEDRIRKGIFPKED